LQHDTCRHGAGRDVGSWLARNNEACAKLTIPSALNDVARLLMNIHVSIGPVVALIAGILILVIPRLLNYIVAIYLIIIGLLGLFG
jgi:Protein of unknown function (DUF3096)